MKLTKKPTATLVLKRSAHKVDEYSLVVFLKEVRRRTKEVLQEEIKHGVPMLVVKITAKLEALVDGVHSYLLWVDKSPKLLKVAESYVSRINRVKACSLMTCTSNLHLARVAIFKS